MFGNQLRDLLSELADSGMWPQGHSSTGSHIPYRLRGGIALLNAVPVLSRDSVVYDMIRESGRIGRDDEPVELRREASRNPGAELGARAGVLEPEHLALLVGAGNQVAAGIGHDDVHLGAQPRQQPC